MEVRVHIRSGASPGQTAITIELDGRSLVQVSEPSERRAILAAYDEVRDLYKAYQITAAQMDAIIDAIDASPL